jgi:hypothetical protein
MPMTMLLLKRSGALDRDVIFLAESGEQADPGCQRSIERSRRAGAAGDCRRMDAAITATTGAGRRSFCARAQILFKVQLRNPGNS